MLRHSVSLLIAALTLSVADVCFGQIPAGPAAGSADRQPWRAQIESELRGDILPFWLEHTRDRRRGGFFGEVDNDLTVHPDAPRGALLTARVLWTFSAAYRRYRDPAYLGMARWAYADLQERFWDRQDGGLYWTVTAAGRPLNTRKELYVQAFGIYALSEYSRATGDRAALQQAIVLYHTVEAHCHDRAHLGYYEEFTRDWTLVTDMRKSLLGSTALKSQNVHLHLMEAYTALLQVWPDPGLRANLREIVGVMLDRILDPANHHLRLFLDADWTPRSTTISFGHDIEASRLLPEAAAALGDKALEARCRTIALQMARATLDEGVDTDGGLLSEAGPAGLSNTNKEWWQQAEALTGFFHAYQLSGDPRYLAASQHEWTFIETHFIDHKYGGWYRLLARNDTVLSRDKASLWKCPYHNSRACLEMIAWLGEGAKSGS
jgi:cellobiose epimerase